MPGTFVVSLDMELMWGVRDHATKEQYGHRVLGEREAIPAMLDLFERNSIRASWAVVGMAMCDGVDEIVERAPDAKPSYTDPRRSTYYYLGEAGASERQDPYYFAPSMVRRIAACPGQEICTHTFSHYNCLEPGQTPPQFEADIIAARRLLDDWGLPCRSIIFPRNQYAAAHLDICAAQGISSYRGGEQAWFYDPGTHNTAPLRRIARLADSYLPLSGANVRQPVGHGEITNVPSSRLLRAYNRRLRKLEWLRLHRITSAMTHAARTGGVFHMWWHPHNFGADQAENIAFLSKVLVHFGRLRDSTGMRSATMSEAAASG